MPNFNLDDYVSVAERVQTFRKEHPGWAMLSEVLVDDGERIVMQATVYDDEQKPVARGHAEEIRGKGMVNTTSAVENAETSAWGRALANLGLHVSKQMASRDEIQQARERADRMKDPLADDKDKLKARVSALTAADQASFRAWQTKESMPKVSGMNADQLETAGEWVANAEDARAHDAEPSLLDGADTGA